MGRSQRALPRDLGLELRMWLAMLFLALLLAAALFGAALLVARGAGPGLFFPLVLLLSGFVLARERPRLASWGTRDPTPEDEARVRDLLQRLAVIADVRPPRVEVVRARPPLSWTTALRPSRATVHVTTALLDRLGDRELEAALAHELGHLINRDAIVMTALAGPPAYLLLGMRMAAREGVVPLVGMLLFCGVLLPPAFVMLTVSRGLSRYREFAADRAAALLTGSSAAVAAALVSVGDELSGMRRTDLRRAAALDSFHFMPTREPRWFGRPWATHPRLERRLERLGGLEAAAQHPLAHR